MDRIDTKLETLAQSPKKSLRKNNLIYIPKKTHKKYGKSYVTNESRKLSQISCM